MLLLLQGLGSLGGLGRQLLAVAAPGRVELHQDVVVGLLVPRHEQIKVENEPNPGGKTQEKSQNSRETDRDDSVEVVVGQNEHSVLLLDLLEATHHISGQEARFEAGKRPGRTSEAAAKARSSPKAASARREALIIASKGLCACVGQRKK